MNKIKQTEKKVISILEIFVMIVSVFTLAYILGDEFRVVSAADLPCTSPNECQELKCKTGWQSVPGDCSAASAANLNVKYACCESLCGNTQIDSTEKCDTKYASQAGLGKEYCATLEPNVYSGGIAICKSDCSGYDMANCIKINTGTKDSGATVEGEEECDDSVPNNVQSCECGIGSPYKGTQTCVNGQWGPCEKCTPDWAQLAAPVTTVGTNLATKEVSEALSGNKPTTTGTTPVATTLGESFKTGWWYIIANAAAATALGYGAYYLSITLGGNAQWSEQLGWYVGLGYGAGYIVGVFAELFGVTGAAFGPLSFAFGAGGAVFGFAVCLLGYCKEARIDRVMFTCYPWQPEAGGENCGECNKGQFPCTKYKCESLGLGCELLNPGTDKEVCAWKNRNDIAPPVISSWNGPLAEDYEYTPDTAILPPDKGVRIVYTGTNADEDGCIPPFSKVTYGFSLSDEEGNPKPGKCRADINVRKDKYKDMSVILSNGLSIINHTLIAFHGRMDSSVEGGLNIPNGGEYEVFVRCESVNGYSNDGTFIFKYCVNDEPDRTAPNIVLTDPLNGWPVQFGQIDEAMSVYTDKPAECKWSHKDEDFDLMTGAMTCDQNLAQINANLLYECSTTLTGLLDGVDNKFYFRCKSYPGNPEEERYKNEESYVYTLIGTRPLVIDYVTPDGTTIEDATDSIKVTLEAHTSAGYKDGESICYYKEAVELDDNYVAFATDYSSQNALHTQELWFTEGGYDYTVKCCDLGNNCDTEDISFIVETDRDAPIVTRVYNDNKMLKIITNEEAECVYDLTDCTYNFADGVAMTTTNRLEHTTTWNTDTYFYIKCKDQYGREPYPNECSIVARPFSGY